MLIQWFGFFFGHPIILCVVSVTNETVSDLSNASDFKKFKEILVQGKIFYILNVQKDSFLPRGSLSGLNVSGLVVDDPHFLGFEEEAFEGVVRLDNVFVMRSSATADISGGAQPARPASDQVPLIPQQLHRVRRAGRIPGHGWSNILGHLSQPADTPPPDLFKPWTKLDTVELSHNQLLHVDQLFFRTNPKEIFLGHNNLTDLDSVLHPGMYNVGQLDLSHNPFTRVTENSFNGKFLPTSLDLGSRTLTKTSPLRSYSSVMQFNISSSSLTPSRHLDCLGAFLICLAYTGTVHTPSYKAKALPRDDAAYLTTNESKTSLKNHFKRKRCYKMKHTVLKNLLN
ncbi:uncharacterized protein CEXT_170991 [Caerostris extrusa]|uniref:Uncharacterized protein n=1 Tax=Caerostris extrusa TaxID=172846 RepID=A0AAV4XUA6_CAEEX|nr:uncharacterized protein CEXT_170991 [Caerostris extrusa]